MVNICLAVADVKNVSYASLFPREEIVGALLTVFAVYVWRIRNLPTSSLDFGVVCEHVYHPESEHADLRIMSFDVTSRGTAHLITMVFSDSSIKVSHDFAPECSLRSGC